VKSALLFAASLALAACGDGFHQGTPMPDGSPQPMPDAMADATPDAPPMMTNTFTDYVKNLITNGTSNTAAPRAYIEFATLSDPDGTNNNTSAYSSLFP
jgi:hypothetical protein